MNIGIFRSQSWHQLNQALRAEVTIYPDRPLQAYLGVSHAASEVASSLASLYDHKMAVGVVQGTGPVESPLSIYFSRRGYSVQRISASEEKTDLLKWVSELKKDTLFVLLENDNPVSGQIYDFDDVKKALNDRKIFVLNVMNNCHWRFLPKDLLPFEVSICGMRSNRALSFLGERVNFQPFVSQSLDWTEFSVDSFVASMAQPFENRKVVEAFERLNIAGMQSFFTADENRLYDRAVVFWQNFDGAAVAQLLEEKISSMPNPILGKTIETTSLCRWSEIQPWQWFNTVPSEKFQGTLIFHHSILNKNLEAILPQILQELSSLQSYEI